MLHVQWMWCKVFSMGANTWLLEMPTFYDTAEYKGNVFSCESMQCPSENTLIIVMEVSTPV